MYSIFFIFLVIVILFLEVNGKVQSLEEIESRLRMSSSKHNGIPPSQNNIQYYDEMKMKKMQSMKVSF